VTISDARFSRLVASAEGLGDHAVDRHRFLEKRVLLTGEPEALSTTNGAVAMDACLRLLPRITRHVVVALPADSPMRQDVNETAESIVFGNEIEIVSGSAPNAARFDAVLNIGTTVRRGQPWTAVTSSGWLSWVSSETNLPPAVDQTNSIAAVFAASLGVAEVFKRLVGLKPGRGKLLDGFGFDLFRYQSASGDLGPQLPDRLPMDLVLVGAGAIGNGVVYLLKRLPAVGKIRIVDRDDFRTENLGTSVLIGPADLGKQKAVLTADYLRGAFESLAYPEEFAAFRARLGREEAHPAVILGALDSVETRHEIQYLWPDLVIDGALGGFLCQVTRHAWEERTACLRCVFQRPGGESAELVASRASGLRLGRQICSVVAEAVARQISSDPQPAGFAPSVPFVATVSACMMVSELAKASAGWPTVLETRFQWDALRGPHLGQLFPQTRRPDCFCSQRGSNIDGVKARRRTGPGTTVPNI